MNNYILLTIPIFILIKSVLLNREQTFANNPCCEDFSKSYNISFYQYIYKTQNKRTSQEADCHRAIK